MDIIETDKTCQAAFQLAKEHMHPAIFNHCVRVYLYAQTVFRPSSLLFVACLLHDLGATDLCSGSERFEVEGADKAVQLLESQGIAKEECHQVWIAIALHTSPGIAERISTMANSVRIAVLTDFGRGGTIDQQIEADWPRLDIEKVLGDKVVANCLPNPTSSAPAASWPGLLYRAHLADPNNTGVSKAF